MAKCYTPAEAARLRSGTGGTSSPDGKPKSRPLTTADLESIAKITADAIRRAVDREVAERLVPLTKEVAELREQLAETQWELDGLREKAGAKPLRRTFEKIVGATYDASGRVVNMTKEVLTDE